MSLRRSPALNITPQGRCIGLLLALGAAVLLAACGSGSTYSAEVHPGDPEYPAENPHASATVDFTAIVPSTLHPLFSSAYQGLAPSCRRIIGSPAGPTGPPGFDVPLHVTQTGNTYQGTLVIDRFEPGGCNWQFTAFGFETREPAAYGGLLLRYDERPDSPVDVRLNIWCARLPKLSPDHPELCGSSNLLAGYVSVPEASIPVNARAGEARIGPNTRTVIVEFHDIDTSRR